MPQQITITQVQPQVSEGHNPAKVEIDQAIKVKATIFKEGHSVLEARIKYRKQTEETWSYSPLQLMSYWDEYWEGSFCANELGIWSFSIESWVDSYGSWLKDFRKKFEAGSAKEQDFQEGFELIKRTYGVSQNNLELASFISKINENFHNQALLFSIFTDQKLAELTRYFQEKESFTVYEKELEIWAEPVKARFAAWYEMFPRSASNSEVISGTFKDCLEKLEYIKELGFDTIYFPPIHPIGKTNRKGKNNSLVAEPEDVGCPWAIGDVTGGHKSIHPELGSFEDFDNLIQKAKSLNLEIALDFAIQCSPDHPYLTNNPDWFFVRPDGSIKYAENPPKEYQDIYPLNFWCNRREELWTELKSIVTFWIERGVKTFRVDNPHTKPVAFWKELIREVKTQYPEVIFLSEAFTTPNRMYELAKIGFTQSYTYFTWKNSACELKEYLSEITKEETANFFRGNLFTNTPDILHEYLQKGGRAAFMIRAILAATLSSVYGIYSGFELCENSPIQEGSEEYLDSEKYQLKARDWNNEQNIKSLIQKLNNIRLQNPALQLYKNLKFYETHNPNLLVYGKTCAKSGNHILVIINTNPYKTEEGSVKFAKEDFGFSADRKLEMKDLLTGNNYFWTDEWNYVKLDPNHNPAHVFQII